MSKLSYENRTYSPPEVAHAADQLAQQLGLSSDELFTAALTDFIRRHKSIDVTAELDKIYAEVDSALDPVLSAMQFKSLPTHD
jgi:hypothetical protein